MTPEQKQASEGAGPGSDALEAEVEALRREVERLRAMSSHDRGLLDAVLNHSPHGIIVCNALGKLTLQNRASERIWAGSATADNVEGWGQYRAFHLDGRPYEPQDWSMARCLSRGETMLAEENRIQRFDGTFGWVLGSSAPIFGPSGELEGALAVFADITEFKLLELERAAATQSASENAALFGATLMSVGDAVITTDGTGRVSLMNGVAESLTGWLIADAKGQMFDEVFHILDEATRAVVESPVKKALREGKVVGLVNHTVLVRRDGAEVSIDDSAAPIQSANGDAIGAVMVFRDVSEKRREELRKQFISDATTLLASSLDYEKTLASICRLAVPRIADWCAIDVVGPDGELRRLSVAHVDPAKVELAHDLHRRYPPDKNAPQGVHQVLRTGRSELVPLIPESMLESSVPDAEHLKIIRTLGLKSYMAVAIKAGERTLGAIVFVTSESQRAFTETDLKLAEQLARSAAIAMDNSRLFEAEKAARARAELASRIREDLLAVVSHDLKNPLSSIVTATALLQTPAFTQAPERAQKYLAMIARAAGNMNRLIGDLLDWASMESGTFAVNCNPEEVGPVVHECVEMLSPLAATKSLRLEYEADKLGIWALCDAARVHQILSNLVGNAIKFTPDGGSIRINLETVANEVRISVADTGPGIGEAELPHVFDRYWRAAQNDRTTGIGLGLSIAKGLVEAQGGRIWVESRVERGAVFFFTLRSAQASIGCGATGRDQR